ncbi:TIGR03751 family conjugal transfer lipoprotein [Saezia sanguinis]|uniref:TIGR03751 family conjugal transfer lipoprotein n=1 Tax=Saezia sanguinis TaxID=1965230 RepID=UPI0030240EFA
MRENLIKTILAIFVGVWLVVSVSGCATSAEDMLTHGDRTMMDIWHVGTSGNTGQANRQLLDARQALRRPLTNMDIQHDAAAQATYTRTAHNEIERQFQRLPNPDMLMYVFPHLSVTDPVPVPGYTTVFPLYQRIQYAMPGERVEPY